MLLGDEKKAPGSFGNTGATGAFLSLKTLISRQKIQ